MSFTRLGRKGECLEDGMEAKLEGYLKPSETCDVIRFDCSDS